MLKKTLTVLLALVMVISLFTVLPVSVSAEDVRYSNHREDIAAVGADSVLANIGKEQEFVEVGYTAHTRDEAVAWARNQVGSTYDSNYGYQCVNLVREYYAYLGQARPIGNANTYLSDSNYHKPDGWTINWGTSGIQPGDIMVYDGGTWGHVAIVVETGTSSCTIMEQNGDGLGDRRTEGSKGRLSTRYYSTITGYIHPDFPSPDPPTNPWISASSISIPVGGSITFSFGADGATNYWIGIDRDGNRIITEHVASGVSYTFSETGNYSAYITAYNSVGGTDSDRVYFTVGPPTKPWIKASRMSLPAGWTNTFTFGADYAMAYWIGIDRDGTRIITETVTSGKSYTFNEAGNYTAYITASNYVDSVDSEKVSFTVWDAHNIGDKFIAAILNTSTGVAVTVDNDENVVVKQYKGTNDQLWLFERQGEYKNYKITNIKTGKCLDDKNFGTADDTNVIVWEDNGGDAQRWFIRPNGSGYSLVPKCAPHGCIDMWGGVYTDGNNIAMWKCAEGNDNQIFTLQLVASPDFSDTYNGHKYELYNTSVSWKEANQFCEQQGGHLVTITSQEEQRFINSMLTHSTNNRIWAGGHDSYAEGRWQWITNEALDFKNWNSGEPSNTDNEDYLMMYKSNGKWNDVADIFKNTDNMYSFICEYEPNDIILGDADGDGEISTIDVTLIQRSCAQLPTNIDPDVLMNADVDGNGELEITDATWLQRYLAQMPTPYQIG